MGTTLSQPAPTPTGNPEPGLGLDFAPLRVRMAARLAGLRSGDGLVPVCSWCRKVRNGAGAWVPVEQGLLEGAGPALTHGVCPDCARELLDGAAGAA